MNAVNVLLEIDSGNDVKTKDELNIMIKNLEFWIDGIKISEKDGIV